MRSSSAAPSSITVIFASGALETDRLMVTRENKVEMLRRIISAVEAL